MSRDDHAQDQRASHGSHPAAGAPSLQAVTGQRILASSS